MTILTTLALPDTGRVDLTRADHADIPALVGLLVDDPICAGREAAGDLASYETAFDAIDADPAHLLLVARANGHVVGTLQLSFIPGMARRGALRGQIEAVRVHESYRSRGLGSQMFAWPSRSRAHTGARWCSSPPTEAAPTRTGSTSASGSRRLTTGSSWC